MEILHNEEKEVEKQLLRRQKWNLNTEAYSYPGLFMPDLLKNSKLLLIVTFLEFTGKYLKGRNQLPLNFVIV